MGDRDGDIEPNDDEPVEPTWRSGSLAWWFGIGRPGRSPFRRLTVGIAAVVCLIWILIKIWPGPNGLNQYFGWLGLAESSGEATEPVPSKPFNTIGREIGASPCPDDGPVVITQSDVDQFGEITLSEPCRYVVRGVEASTLRGPIVNVHEEGELTIVDSTLEVRYGNAVSLFSPEAGTTIRRSTLRSTQDAALDAQRADVEIVGSTFVGQPAIDASSEAHVELTDSEVDGGVERSADSKVSGASDQLDRRQAMETFVDKYRRGLCEPLRSCIDQTPAAAGPTHVRVVGRVDENGNVTELASVAPDAKPAVVECARKQLREVRLDPYPHAAPGFVDCHLPDDHERFNEYQFVYKAIASDITLRSIRRVYAAEENGDE